MIVLEKKLLIVLFIVLRLVSTLNESIFQGLLILLILIFLLTIQIKLITIYTGFILIIIGLFTF